MGSFNVDPEHLFLMLFTPKELDLMSDDETEPFKPVEYRTKHFEVFDPYSQV